MFHTRWALSYLRGPLTRSQIQDLMEHRRAEASVGAAPAPVRARAGTRQPESAPVQQPAGEQPPVPAEVSQLFLATAAGGLGADERLLYRPALLGSAQLHYVRARNDVDEWGQAFMLAALPEKVTGDVWREGEFLEQGEPRLLQEGESGASFSKLPAAATRAKSYSQWGKSLANKLYRERALRLWRCRELKVTSSPDEGERDFRARLQQLAREKRDLQIAKLEKRFTPKLARLRDRLRRAEERVAREKSQYGQQQMQTAISVGATVLGAMFGRKIASVGTVGRASTAMRGMGRAAREKGDIARATRELEVQQQRLVDLEREFEQETQAIRESSDPSSLEVENIDIRPRKSDIVVDRVALVWTPWRVGPDGIAEPG